MDPIKLFHLLRGRLIGLQLFRAAVGVRCWGLLAASWALEEWVVADLPGRGWAMRKRLGMEQAWQADRSRMRYLRALQSDQPG